MTDDLPRGGATGELVHEGMRHVGDLIIPRLDGFGPYLQRKTYVVKGRKIIAKKNINSSDGTQYIISSLQINE